MAISAAPAAAEARSDASRLRLAPNRVYACRFCREAVRVTSTALPARVLPDLRHRHLGGGRTLRQPGRLRGGAPSRERRPLPLPRVRLQRLDADRAPRVTGDRRHRPGPG